MAPLISSEPPSVSCGLKFWPTAGSASALQRPIKCSRSTATPVKRGAAPGPPSPMSASKTSKASSPADSTSSCNYSPSDMSPKADNAVGLKSEGGRHRLRRCCREQGDPRTVTRNEAGYLMIDNDPILWTMLNAIEQRPNDTAARAIERPKQGDRAAERAVGALASAGPVPPRRKIESFRESRP